MFYAGKYFFRTGSLIIIIIAYLLDPLKHKKHQLKDLKKPTNFFLDLSVSTVNGQHLALSCGINMTWHTVLLTIIYTHDV